MTHRTHFKSQNTQNMQITSLPQSTPVTASRPSHGLPGKPRPWYSVTTNVSLKKRSPVIYYAKFVTEERSSSTRAQRHKAELRLVWMRSRETSSNINSLFASTARNVCVTVSSPSHQQRQAWFWALFTLHARNSHTVKRLSYSGSGRLEHIPACTEKKAEKHQPLRVNGVVRLVVSVRSFKTCRPVKRSTAHEMKLVAHVHSGSFQLHFY